MISKEILHQEYILNNLSKKEISSKYNVNQRTIKRRLSEYRIKKPIYTKTLTREDKEDIINCYKKGIIVRDIAIKYNINRNRITSLLNSVGAKLYSQPQKDISGNKYNFLSVIKPLHNKNCVWFYECICDCGNKCIVSGACLKSGNTKSCGCRISIKNNLNYGWTGYEDITGNFWSAIQRNAKSRDFSFNISIEFAWNLFIKQDRKCAYTNSVLVMPYPNKDKSKKYASLDRIDSNIGYEENNIQWVDKDINIMKNKFSHNNFIDLCTLVYKGTVSHG